MRKILVFLLNFLFVFQSLLSPIKTYAAETTNCKAVTPTFIPNQNTINLDIDVSNVTATDTKQAYSVYLDAQKIQFIVGDTTGYGATLDTFPPKDGHIKLSDVPPPSPDQNFQNRTYAVTVRDNQGTPLCIGAFGGQQTLEQWQCAIDITSKPEDLTPNNPVKIKINHLSGNQSDTINVTVKKYNDNGTTVNTFPFSIASLQAPDPVSIGGYDSGSYFIKVENNSLIRRTLCVSGFTVGINGGGFGTPNPSPSPAIIPCTEGLSVPDNPYSVTRTPEAIVKCTKVATAFGIEISTDPAQFVKALFGILLSLAGGIAIVLIIIAGYRLMFSEGNPEKAQAAREQLTSAIVGLLFIIFSMTILTVIGVDILHIPGFTR